MTPPQTLAEALEVIAWLQRELVTLRAENAQLRAENVQLRADNEELRRKLGQHSGTSSKPPSSDGPAAPPRPAARPRGRLRGGQKGHRGAFRALVDEPDAVVDCRPPCCGGCGQTLHGIDVQPERHQVTELPEVRAHVTEYRRHALRCPCCAAVTRGALPAGVDAGAFGPRLRAMVGWLAGSFSLSHRDIVRLLGDGFGVAMGLGSVASCEAFVSGAVRPAVEALHTAGQAAPVVHADETSFGLHGRRGWLWVAVTEHGTLFLLQPGRTRAAAEALLGTPPAEQTLVSDRFASYEWFASDRRQVCWAHLLRQAREMAEASGAMGDVGAALVAAIEELFHAWHRFRTEGLSRVTLQRWMAPVQTDIEAQLERGAALDHALAGRCGEILRMRAALFTFVTTEGVEPTNNAAERALRHGVLWRKGSYGVQSVSGQRFVGRILSVVETLRRQGRRVLGYLTQACEAALRGLPAPSLLPVPNAEPP